MIKTFILGLVLLGLFTVFGCKDMDNGNGPPPPPPPPPPPEQRVMSILWCGDEQWAEAMRGISIPTIRTLFRDAAETWDTSFGGTHIVGFLERVKPDWYEGTKVKLIMYLKTDDLGKIRDEVIRWRNHPNLGGYWFISGHEPDITGYEPSFEENKKLRREQYELVRKLDPDAWNHPVVIWYNCTGQFAHYPGWQNAFPTPEEGVDCNIYAADVYPINCDGTTDYSALESIANNLVVIGLERSNGQYIPCMGAFVEQGCQAVSLLEQWEWWEEWYRNQTGEELSGAAFYFSGLGSVFDGVYENETLGREAREINRRLGLRR